MFYELDGGENVYRNVFYNLFILYEKLCFAFFCIFLKLLNS